MPLSHLDETGAAHMVDISSKPVTQRQAIAEGRIAMSAEAIAAIRAGSTKKGDVIATARIAGIMATKQTSTLIPLCHPLPVDRVAIDFAFDDTGIAVRCTIAVAARTGAEMEALTGASIALLTLYDMAKAIDKAMVIEQVRLVEKTGGKSGDWRRA